MTDTWKKAADIRKEAMVAGKEAATDAREKMTADVRKVMAVNIRKAAIKDTHS